MAELPDGQEWSQQSQTWNIMSENISHGAEDGEPALKRAKITIDDDHSYSNNSGTRFSQDGQQFILNEKPFDTGRSISLFESQDNYSEKHLDGAKSDLVSNDADQQSNLVKQFIDSEQFQNSERSSRQRPPEVFYFLENNKLMKSFKQTKKEQNNVNYSKDIFDSDSEAHSSSSKKKARKDESINYSIDVFGSMELIQKDLPKSFSTKRLNRDDNAKNYTTEEQNLDRNSIEVKRSRSKFQDKKSGNLSTFVPKILTRSYLWTQNLENRNSPDAVDSTQKSENKQFLRIREPYCKLSKIKGKPSTKLNKRFSKNYYPKRESQDFFKMVNFPKIPSKSSNVNEIFHESKKTFLSYSEDVFEPIKPEATKTSFEHNKQKVQSIQDISENSKVGKCFPQLRDPEGTIEIEDLYKVSCKIVSNKSKSENGANKIFEADCSENNQDIQGFLKSRQNENKSSSKQNSQNCLNHGKSRESSFDLKENRPDIKTEKRGLRFSNTGGQFIDPTTGGSHVPDDAMIFSLGSYSMESQYEQFEIPIKQSNSKIVDEFDFLKVGMFDNYEKFKSKNILAEGQQSSLALKELRPEKLEKKILRYLNSGGENIDPVTGEPKVPDDAMTFSLGSYSLESQYEEHFEIPVKQAKSTVKDEFDFLKIGMFQNNEKFKSAKDKVVSTDDLINEMKTILEEANLETEDMIALEGQGKTENRKINNLKTIPEELIKNIKLLRIKSNKELIDIKTAKNTFTYKDFLW